MYKGQVSGTKISREIKKMMGTKGLGKVTKKTSKKVTLKRLKI